ncbi:hypothetical protein TBLA_0G00830 [Henningerozyma blattae CBS 6284]|uniref:Choline/carnitine acyltransferase domain-containing protein n=1 Tax=Henningerozyma blattae (strain ATCC 34711 / CBS 6284 / DSM 70876 / NBRC 10599 / NRRL Y-10934 / UCD 77-7) TaxID=1071380 RepID=I2H6M8_HENB6|nr:hypothetical protein TBLA_0G00830 [Tetrapisispora blattae CBS 6284]CCH62030.1 hypothetical protein TBLA_0G00830 [Tetrapisispora blattae CBS 6284]
MTKETPKLKRLPIPPLEDTLNRFISCVEPLQDEKQRIKTRQKVFSAENLDSMQQLQEKLIEYDEQLAKENPISSYIEQFWYDSYLFYDQSVVLNVNPSFQLQDDPMVNSLTCNIDTYGEYTLQIKRTSKLVVSILKFIKDIRQDNLRPDKIRGKIPLSMDQYDKLFGSSRIPPGPGEETCHLQTDKTSHHVMVMYKGQFYWFDVLDIDNNPIFNSPEELEWNLYSILIDGDNENRTNISAPVGIFTTESRRVWSNIRDYIQNSEDVTNWKNLRIIDSALFVICLDDIIIDTDKSNNQSNFDSTKNTEREKEEESKLVKSMLCGTSDIDFENKDNVRTSLPLGIQKGTCLNRWYDKLQLIITRNGKAGINFEHTGIDGHTVLRLVTDIYTDSILNFASEITKDIPSVFNLSKSFNEKVKVSNNINDSNSMANLITIPRKLEWKIDSFLKSSLHFAETRVSDLISQYEFVNLDFNEYGGHWIKKVFKCSPDAFTQQIFQIAFYALYGKFETTYEPAMTKTFQNGRTEAIRTVTFESQKFVKSLFERNVTDEKRIEYLHEACSKHSAITKECSLGLGHDRHLYALYCIWRESFQEKMDLPPLFKDGSWSIMNNNTLSTSNCGNPCLKNFGFGPVVPNGFGIGYVIRDNSISIVVSSKHKQTKRFVALIEKSFVEVLHMFQRTTSTAPKTNQDSEQYMVELRSTGDSQEQGRSKALSYLLGGYDYFDVSITG